MRRLQGLFEIFNSLFETVAQGEVDGRQSRQDEELIGFIDQVGFVFGLLLLQLFFLMEQSIQLAAHLLGIQNGSGCCIITRFEVLPG